MSQGGAKIVGKADAATLARMRLCERRKKAKRVRAKWRTALGENIRQQGESR